MVEKPISSNETLNDLSISNIKNETKIENGGKEDKSEETKNEDIFEKLPVSKDNGERTSFLYYVFMAFIFLVLGGSLVYGGYYYWKKRRARNVQGRFGQDSSNWKYQRINNNEIINEPVDIEA